jgi:hypothetical protein
MRKGKRLEFLDATEFEVITWGSTAYDLELDKSTNKGSKEQKCLLKGDQSFFGYYKFEVQNAKNISMHVGKGLCKDSSFKGDRNLVLNRKLDFTIHENVDDSYDMKCEPQPQSSKVLNEDLLEEDDDPPEIIQEKVDEQSQRIGLKLYAHRFSQEGLPNMNFEEWRFLELASTIFKKSCPQGMVSAFFVDNILVLFRFLLQESFNLFPPNVDEDDETRTRIWDALNHCSANASILDFRNAGVCSKEVGKLKYYLTSRHLSLHNLTFRIRYSYIDKRKRKPFCGLPN